MKTQQSSQQGSSQGNSSGYSPSHSSSFPYNNDNSWVQASEHILFSKLAIARNCFNINWLDKFKSKLVELIAWERPITSRGLPIRRSAAWFYKCKCPYAYAGISFTPQPFPSWFLPFQSHVLATAQCKHIGFDSCNINMYENGSEHVDWHADNESLFALPHVVDVPILSLSLGAKRSFLVRCNSNGQVSKLMLDNGDLVFMGWDLQQSHKHKVPSDYTHDLRINITWRKLVNCKC